MKKFLVISMALVALALFIFVGNSAQAETAYVQGGKLNVREEPSLQATRVGGLANHTKVEVLEWLEDWALIDYKGEERYVMAKYLSLKKPAVFEIPQQEECSGEPTTVYYVRGGRLNIRLSTSKRSTLLGYFRTGDRVKVHSIENGWARIHFKDGKDAYVMAEFLSKKNPTAPSAPSFGGRLRMVGASSLNVRKEAKKDSKCIQVLKYGDVVEVLNVKNGWASIRYRGWRPGYVMVQYLTKYCK